MNRVATARVEGRRNMLEKARATETAPDDGVVFTLGSPMNTALDTTADVA